jgi:RNA polymerase sigma-70 factor (sigma-E family)
MTEVYDDEFTRYVKKARPSLRRTAFGFTADWFEADDLVQRTLLALYSRWEKLDHRDRIAAYAHRTMARLFISDRRARHWSHEIPCEQPPETEPAPDTCVVYGDRLLLVNALAELGPRQRAAVVLRYWDDRSVEETAEALGCVCSTIRSQTARALATLRSALAPAFDESGG